jgi:ATP-dependent helicase/nuclease subunit A
MGMRLARVVNYRRFAGWSKNAMINENSMQQDQANRLLALDIQQSFIVQAPAGSGKTELLIQRFLKLLTVVNAPEEVLAITFTNKAAREMRSRIIKALMQAYDKQEPLAAHAKKTYVLAQAVLARDQQYQWHLLDNPNQLRIQTIDALCSYLTAQLPILSQFGAKPEISADPTPLYRQAVIQVLGHVEETFAWSDAIANLLSHFDNNLNQVHDLLVNLLAKRDQWLPYIQFNNEEKQIKQQLESYLSAAISEHLTVLHAQLSADWLKELVEIARFAAQHCTDPASPLLVFKDFLSLPGIKAEDKKLWLGLLQLLFTKSHSWRKRFDAEVGFPPLSQFKNPEEKAKHRAYRDRLNALIEEVQDKQALEFALIEVFFLPNAEYSQTQWSILQALLSVLKIVAAQLRVIFQEQGTIDFIENAQAAALALGTADQPTDLALHLDYQIRHILLDEFQDTSITQFELLEKLTAGWEVTDGRTLFIVGDPMQSIYRFREAEVGLFIRLQTEMLGHLQLTPLKLTLNFRSHAEIVEWNNHHFKQIFPDFNEVATGAISYSPSVSTLSPLAALTEESMVMISALENANETAHAAYVVDAVLRDRKNYPNDKIAILVRSRSHLAEIIPALKKSGLNYHAVDIDPLATRPAIQDLLALTCALLHPADRIAWLSILRAPWCGLCLADLLLLANADPEAILWENISNADLLKKLSEDGQRRLTKMLDVINDKMLARERLPFRTWVETIWLLLGGPAGLEAETDIEDANAYFALLSDFEKTDLLLNIDKLKEKINKLFASTHASNDSLQLMTIHSAKGLEFDTIILPHLERKTVSDEHSLLTWLDCPSLNGKHALLLAAHPGIGQEQDPLYAYIRRQYKIKSNYETKRLLYVAATRARKRLYLTFSAHEKQNADLNLEEGSFLKHLWPHLNRNYLRMIPPTLDALAMTHQQFIKPACLKRVSPTWQHPISERPALRLATHLKKSGFHLPDQQAKIIGIVTHLVLQRIAEKGCAWWQDHPKKQQAAYLFQQFLQAGMPAHAIQQSQVITAQSIENTLADACGRWIIKPHQAAKSEYALTSVIDNQIQHFIIDRTFIDDDGIRWIIDYKTATLNQQALDVFLGEEEKKYAEKMRQYKLAFQHLEQREIKLMLYFPALPANKVLS